MSIKDATKFGNLEYERGVKDGIQHAKNHQWKPSEEQMDYLSGAYASAVAENDEKTARVLGSLHDDLLKLNSHDTGRN